MADFKTTDARQIGALVRQERNRQGLDQRTLALIANVGVSAVHRVEHGEGVRLETLINVLSALGLELVLRRRGGNRP
jgi:transcriptional regulator with XRE-family HTH domain